jgi:geranylgeranyl pyrophosphate synthase
MYDFVRYIDLIHLQTFSTQMSELREMAQYYFDGQGKTFRPLIVLLMAKALNVHENNVEM